MARRLVVACLAVFVFGTPSVAQEAPPEPITINLSGFLTTEECGTDVAVTIPGGLKVTLCQTHPPPTHPSPPAHPSPPSPSQPVVAPAPLPSVLSPFPIVRLVGSVTRGGTRIHLLEVRAPKGAHALVRCRGRRCPVKRAEKVIARTRVRFAAFERLMPAKVVIEVLVRKGDRIGKYTRFELRRNRRPRRADGCVWPGTTRMAPCPEA
jgi:hypothetical protein